MFSAIGIVVIVSYTVRPLLSGQPRDLKKWPALDGGWPLNRGTKKLERKGSKRDFLASI